MHVNFTLTDRQTLPSALWGHIARHHPTLTTSITYTPKTQLARFSLSHLQDALCHLGRWQAGTGIGESDAQISQISNCLGLGPNGLRRANDAGLRRAGADQGHR